MNEWKTRYDEQTQVALQALIDRDTLGALLERALLLLPAQHTLVTDIDAALQNYRRALQVRDPVVTAIEQIEEENTPLEHETLVLLRLAKEAQRTGVMPDLTSLGAEPKRSDTDFVCEALNRLFWSCPIPDRLHGENETDKWAEYWLAELQKGPIGTRFKGITWDRVNSVFQANDQRQATASK